MIMFNNKVCSMNFRCWFFLYLRVTQYPNRQVENPANRVPVTADQIDIFTAQVVAGGRRRSTRRRRVTRRRHRR